MPGSFFDDPMFQAGIAPFVLALALVGGLARLRRPALAGLGWFAVSAAVLTTVALATGISFSPLTAARKIVLLVMLAPLIGLVLDRLEGGERAGGISIALIVSVLAGLASLWVFQSALAQREGAGAWLMGGGVAIFVAALLGLCLRLRADGAAAGAAALGLGLAVGVGAVLSASIGNLMNGLALAMAAAALLLVQLLRGEAIPAGYLGALSFGLAAALFAAATLVLAELRWYSLALLLALPLVAGAGLYARRAFRPRLVLLGITLVIAALGPIVVAWLAARAPAG
jgi:hypothetical protein